MRDVLVLAIAIIVSAGTLARAQTDPISDAVDALRRGDMAGAEQILREELRKQPENPDALAVLAVVLDQQTKYSAADEVYRHAMALSPRSTPLLNNYANHLLATRKPDQARDVFLKLLALNPAHANARLQLARLALENKQPAEALRYLEYFTPGTQQSPEVEITRMEALFAVHRNAEAEAILARFSSTDPKLNNLLGVALASAGQYEKAEDRFSKALESDPDNFDIIYRLGLAASRAGHNERARDILQSALRRQPQNVDVLYDLAAVNAQMGRQEAAVQLLAEANRYAPERADVLQLLARLTAGLGYFADAIHAWDSYLKLVPADDIARRERAFAATAIGEDMDRGLGDLKAFATKHPDDAVGQYELGVAEASSAPDDALMHLNRAIGLKPGLTAAVIARGLLHFKQANFVAALSDFQTAARSDPDNPVILDRLGQTYMALDRTRDAIPILVKAAELAPRDSKTLTHLGRALTSSGRAEEAKAVFTRLRELGPDRSSKPHPAGLVDFLSLSSEDQLARYRAGVERAVQKDPANAEAQVRYLKLLIDDGRKVEALIIAKRLLELGPSAQLLADAGKTLIAAEAYTNARDLLEKAAASDPSPDIILNLAIATSHAVDPRSGLQVLDRIPQPRRTGDYYLARAQMLDGCGRADDAAAAVMRALHENPTRPDLYRYAVSFLIEKRRIEDLLALLDRGRREMPGNADLALMRAVASEAAGRTEEVHRVLGELERHWPDWYKVWLADAIFAGFNGGDESHQRQMIETAESLGATNAAESFARAVDFAGKQPDHIERATRLMQALFP